MCEREREGDRAQQTVVSLSDEADGNHGLDRQGREKVGEEEIGLNVKSATNRNNILKPFSKTAHCTDFCSAKSRHSNYHGSAS